MLSRHFTKDMIQLLFCIDLLKRDPSESVKDFQNVLRLQRLITLGHSIGFQCNLVHDTNRSHVLVLVALNKCMTCSFRFYTILVFIKNGSLQITRRVLGCKSREFGFGYLINHRN